MFVESCTGSWIFAVALCVHAHLDGVTVHLLAIVVNSLRSKLEFTEICLKLVVGIVHVWLLVNDKRSNNKIDD